MKRKSFSVLVCFASAIALFVSAVTVFGINPPPTPPPGPPKEHSQVVGCGSYNMHDWRPGCCEGYGGCVNQCYEYYQYCD